MWFTWSAWAKGKEEGDSVGMRYAEIFPGEAEQNEKSLAIVMKTGGGTV